MNPKTHIPGAKVITQVYWTTPRGHDIHLDVHVPPALLKDVTGNKKVPVLIAWHGGGLISGSRRDEYIFSPLVDGAAANGWLLVCPDYRLVLPSNGYDIYEDVTHFFSYLCSPAFASSLPNGIEPDLQRVSVMGFSAGGHLVRVSVMQSVIQDLQHVAKGTEPPYRIVSNVPYVGMAGDYLLDWWTVFRNAPENPMSEEEIKAKTQKTQEGTAHLFDPNLPEISDAPYGEDLPGHELTLPREHIWDWWGTHSTVLDVLTGEKGLGARIGALPYEQRLEALDPKYAPVIPQIWYQDLISNPPSGIKFPPTLLIHGTKDEAVPYEESINAQKQLKAANLPVEMITLPDGNHNLCYPGTEDRVPLWQETHEKAIEFIKKSFE